MKLCPTGHATHPQWRMAAALVLAQLRAQMALPAYAQAPALGLLYITDHYADQAQELLDQLEDLGTPVAASATAASWRACSSSRRSVMSSR